MINGNPDTNQSPKANEKPAVLYSKTQAGIYLMHRRSAMKNYTQVYVKNSIEAAELYYKAFGAEITREFL